MRTGISAVASLVAILSGGCVNTKFAAHRGDFTPGNALASGLRSPVTSREASPPGWATAPGSPGRRPRPLSDSHVAYAVLEPPPVPPAPRREMIARRPAREAVWIRGYYVYLGGGRYAWVPGHWEVPPEDKRTFEPPVWEPRGNGYVYVPGDWR